MKGTAFLDCAAEWVSVESAAEPVLRSSVSRAYYGAYHQCLDFIVDVLDVVPKGGSQLHDKLPKVMGFTGHATLVSVGHMLTDLKGWRHDADYRLTIAEAGRRKLAVLAIEKASEVRAMLEAFNVSSSELSRIQEAIKVQIPSNLIGWYVRTRL